MINRNLLPLILNYIKFLRIQDWFYITGLAYLGFFLKTTQLDIKNLFFISFISSLYLAHGYSINNYFDHQRNQANVAGQFKGEFNWQAGLFISVGLFLVNVTLSFFYSKLILLLVISGGVISYLYSSTHIKFKSCFLFNIILNSTGFVILFLIGYLANKPISVNALLLSGYVWLGIVPSQIIHLIVHNPDEKNFLFSLDLAFKYFYLSLLIWLLFSFAGFISTQRSAIFILTLIFCLFQILIIELFKCRNKFSLQKILRIRMIFRYANIILGLILICFLFR